MQSLAKAHCFLSNYLTNVRFLIVMNPFVQLLRRQLVESLLAIATFVRLLQSVRSEMNPVVSGTGILGSTDLKLHSVQ